MTNKTDRKIRITNSVNGADEQCTFGIPAGEGLMIQHSVDDLNFTIENMDCELGDKPITDETRVKKIKDILADHVHDDFKQLVAKKIHDSAICDWTEGASTRDDFIAVMEKYKWNDICRILVSHTIDNSYIFIMDDLKKLYSQQKQPSQDQGEEHMEYPIVYKDEIKITKIRNILANNGVAGSFVVDAAERIDNMAIADWTEGAKTSEELRKIINKIKWGKISRVIAEDSGVADDNWIGVTAEIEKLYKPEEPKDTQESRESKEKLYQDKMIGKIKNIFAGLFFSTKDETKIDEAIKQIHEEMTDGSDCRKPGKYVYVSNIISGIIGCFIGGREFNREFNLEEKVTAIMALYKQDNSKKYRHVGNSIGFECPQELRDKIKQCQADEPRRIKEEIEAIYGGDAFCPGDSKKEETPQAVKMVSGAFGAFGHHDISNRDKALRLCEEISQKLQQVWELL